MMEELAQPERQPLHRVLIVDDMEANRAVMCRRLERFGYAIDSVDSGKAALESIAVAKPDVVLLDYMMPQMNGIEVLRELRQNAATRDLAVIMVTARAESAATIEALDAGADDYVTKPIDFDVLRARIEAHLAKLNNAKNLKRANAALDERVTVRTMTIADLQEELKIETERRRDLERQLSDRTPLAGPTASATAQATPVGEGADAASHVRASMMQVHQKYEAIFAGVTAGRPPNLAKMNELRIIVDQLNSFIGKHWP